MNGVWIACYDEDGIEDMGKPFLSIKSDYLYKHKACILYINDNNGETCFKQKDGTIKKVLPKPNRVVFFDGSNPHCSSTCTDVKRRVNVNFNYF